MRPTRTSSILAFAALAACAASPTGAPASEPGIVDGPPDIVLVGNKRANTLSILDASNGAVLATLPTGAGPHEVAASPDGRTAVVTNYGVAGQPGNSLTIVDIPSRTVTRTISLGEYQRPHGVAFTANPRQVAVTVEVNQAVLIVDLDSAKVVGTIATNQAASHMIAVRADGRVGFTANITAGSITEIDLANRMTGRVLQVSAMTEGVAVSPDGGQVWLGSNTLDKVYVIDTQLWRVSATLESPGLPYRIAITPNGAHALVPSPNANLVRLFDVTGLRELAAIPMPPGAQPVGIAISRDGTTAYVACQGNSTVQVIDIASRRVVGSLPTGAGPDGIAVIPAPRQE